MHFHFKQAIHRITTDETLRKKLINSFFEDTKNEFKQKIKNIKSTCSNRIDKIEKKKTIFLIIIIQ